MKALIETTERTRLIEFTPVAMQRLCRLNEGYVILQSNARDARESARGHAPEQVRS